MAMSSLALWGFSNSSAFAWTFKQFPVAAELISTVMRSAYSMGVLGVGCSTPSTLLQPSALE